MSDWRSGNWPKRMWLDDLGIAGNAPNPGDIEVVVFPATGKASKPFGFINDLPNDMFRWRLSKLYHADEMPPGTPVYLEPPHITAELESLRARQAVLVEALTLAAADVIAERKRQIEREGYSPAHDDEHDDGEMAAAASCYAAPVCVATKIVPHHEEWTGNARHEDSRLVPVGQTVVPQLWPWLGCYWKPGDRRNNLVKAGALILAEIERLDRAALAQQGEG